MNEGVAAVLAVAIYPGLATLVAGALVIERMTLRHRPVAPASVPRFVVAGAAVGLAVSSPVSGNFLVGVGGEGCNLAVAALMAAVIGGVAALRGAHRWYRWAAAVAPMALTAVAVAGGTTSALLALSLPGAVLAAVRVIAAVSIFSAMLALSPMLYGADGVMARTALALSALSLLVGGGWASAAVVVVLAVLAAGVGGSLARVPLLAPAGAVLALLLGGAGLLLAILAGT